MIIEYGIMYINVHHAKPAKRISEDSGFESRAGLSYNELSCWPNGKASDYGLDIYFRLLHMYNEPLNYQQQYVTDFRHLLYFSEKTTTIHSFPYVINEEIYYIVPYYFTMKGGICCQSILEYRYQYNIYRKKKYGINYHYFT